MTVHLISVGLSVLDSLAEPEDKLADTSKDYLIGPIRTAAPTELLNRAGINDRERISDRDRRAASEWLAAALAQADSAPQAALVAAAEAAMPGDWPLRMSAELETFGRVARSTRFSLRAEDIAVLICSDTPLGLLAGAWNALALAGGTFGNVRYVPDPATPEGGATALGDLRGKVVVVRVTGMDASDSRGFSDAMRGLGVLARGVLASCGHRKSRPGPEEFRFYLSGGFKAAIPYLVGLAEAVRSVDDVCLAGIGVPGLAPASGGLYPVNAYMLHETAGRLAAADADVPPIELPLRRLVARVVRDELTEFKDRTCTAGKLPSTALAGYAYEVTGGKPGRETYQLTEFGEGLGALFGLAVTGREGFDL